MSESTKWDMREELWRIYCLSGADPDGADARHLNEGEAKAAIAELRGEYDDACDEIHAGEKRIKELEGCCEELMRRVGTLETQLEVETAANDRLEGAIAAHKREPVFAEAPADDGEGMVDAFNVERDLRLYKVAGISP